MMNEIETRPHPYSWQGHSLCYYCKHFDLASDIAARQAFSDALVRLGKDPIRINRTGSQVIEEGRDPDDPDGIKRLAKNPPPQITEETLRRRLEELEYSTVSLADAKRLRAQFDELPKVRCAAFPDGIPDPIFPGGVFIHDKPFPGDNGIRFDDGNPTNSDLPLDPLAIYHRPDLLDALIDHLVEIMRPTMRLPISGMPPLGTGDGNAISSLIDQRKAELEARIKERREQGKRGIYEPPYSLFVRFPIFPREGITDAVRAVPIRWLAYRYLLDRMREAQESDANSSDFPDEQNE